MKSVLLTVSCLLVACIGCHRTLHWDAEGDAGSTTLTSAPPSNPSDDQITERIEEAIKKDGVMEPQSGEVQPSTSSGVVTLAGRVGSMAAKQRLLAVAQRTPGVTRVVDELTAPTNNPSTSNDAEMTLAIQQRLAARAETNVKVTANNATVVLEGTVTSALEKREVGKLAEQTPNVASVDNRLTVHPLDKFW